MPLMNGAASTDPLEHVVDLDMCGVEALDRAVTGDRLGVVARHAIEVAALQEHDEAIAGAVDVAERNVSATNPVVALSRVSLMAADPFHRSLCEVVRRFAARRQMVTPVTHGALLADRHEVALADEIAGDPDELVAIEVEREVPHPAGERHRG